MYRTLEQPTGRGRLVGEGTDIPVKYALRVVQEIVDAGHSGDANATIPGLKSLDGQVEFDDFKQEFQLFGRTLILHLEDRRRLRVVIQGSGQIQGTGGFLD